MKMKANNWTAEHFSQANPAGPGQHDLPALLRRVAESVEAIGPVEVQDLILHTEVTDNGPWHSLTVYFHRLSATREKNRKHRKIMRSRPSTRASGTRPSGAPLKCGVGVRFWFVSGNWGTTLRLC